MGTAGGLFCLPEALVLQWSQCHLGKTSSHLLGFLPLCLISYSPQGLVPSLLLIWGGPDHHPIISLDLH